MTTTSPISVPFPAAGGDRIIPVPQDLRLDAAARLVCTGGRPDRAAGARFLQDAQRNAIPLDRFWAWVEPDGSIESAVLAVRSPGRTALLFASRPVGFGRGEKIARTLQSACRSLACEGVVIAQGLLEPGERAERKVFAQAKFDVLAHLGYLHRPLSDSPRTERVVWPHGVSIETYAADNHDDFVRALDASYEETLDCPALTGIRCAEDILAGHRATGQFDPALWTLLRVDELPSGVLLLNPSQRLGTVELVYIGLAKPARGRGLGRLLLRHGLTQVSARPEQTMTLAVDEHNVPAIRLYYAAGFRRAFRRVALIRALTDLAAPD